MTGTSHTLRSIGSPEPAKGEKCKVCARYHSDALPHTQAFLNDRTQSLSSLRERLNLGPAQVERFDRLNRHLCTSYRQVLPGDLVLMPEGDDNSEFSKTLRSQATYIHNTLSKNHAPVDDFLIEQYELLNRLLAYAPAVTDATSDLWNRHLLEVEKTLRSIELTHQLHLGPGATGDRDRFIKARARLFQQLERQLRGIGRIATGLQHSTNMKKMLGISTKSYIAKGVIEGYSERINGVSKAAHFMKKGTYIGITLSTTSTVLDIYKSCSLGRDYECKRSTVIEGSKLVGSLAGGFLAGRATGLAAAPLCIAIGLPSAGAGLLACSVVVGTAASLSMSAAGGSTGEYIGENIFEILIE